MELREGVDIGLFIPPSPKMSYDMVFLFIGDFYWFSVGFFIKFGAVTVYSNYKGQTYPQEWIYYYSDLTPDYNVL